MASRAVTSWLVLWSLVLAAVLAPPVGGQSDAETAGAVGRMDTTDRYRLALLRMKGHLGVARALVQIRAAGAGYHLRQPLEDIFRATESELDRRSAPFTADLLAPLGDAADREPLLAIETIETAVTALDGSFAKTGSLSAESALALSEALLREAVARYADAVTDNEVVDLHSYQIGRGFVTLAEALVRYAGALRGRPGHEELLHVVTLIRQAWPGVMPPPIVFDPPSVAERLDEAVAAMDALR